MNKSEYLKHANWHGSCYELAMEFHPSGDDARVLGALRALWSAPSLFGPLESPYDSPEEVRTLLSIVRPEEPAQQALRAVPLPDALDPDSPGSVYGLLTIPGHPAIGCFSARVREEQGSDWLDLCIPTGMLEHIFTLDYPLLTETNHWLLEVDPILLRVADIVYAAAPFDLAMFGEAVSGYNKAHELTQTDLERGAYLVPPALAQRLQPHATPQVLASGLLYFQGRSHDRP